MNGPNPVVHVVDDEDSFRVGIVRLLRAAGYDAYGYASAGEFLLKRQKGVGGCQMPGPSGLQLQEAIVNSDEPLAIIFVSGHGDIPASVRAMKAGAVDFLTKPVRREILLKAVADALAQNESARATREDLSACRLLYERLTAREREVLEGVVAGKMNKEIADELGTPERTVKAHRATMMQKMHVSSVPELVHLADRLRSTATSNSSRPRI